MISEERFLPVPFSEYAEYYNISDHGNVYSVRGKIIMKPQLRGGYPRVTLSNNGVIKHFSVHQLVALVFVDNPNNFKIINHKDSDKTNAHYTNLEWVTQHENARHGAANLKRNWGLTPVYQLSLDDKIIARFDSIKEAADITGVTDTGICAACKGQQKTSHGYKWRYVEEKRERRRT